MSIRSAIENTISISQFNRGLAGKIFDEVKRYGAKVVMKNNSPEFVLGGNHSMLTFLLKRSLSIQILPDGQIVPNSMPVSESAHILQ